MQAYALIRQRADGRWDQVDHYIGLPALEAGLDGFRGVGRFAVMEIEGERAVVFDANHVTIHPPIEESLAHLKACAL